MYVKVFGNFLTFKWQFAGGSTSNCDNSNMIIIKLDYKLSVRDVSLTRLAQKTAKRDKTYHISLRPDGQGLVYRGGQLCHRASRQGATL